MRLALTLRYPPRPNALPHLSILQLEGVWDSIASSKPAGVLAAATAGGAGGGVWDSLSAGADQVIRFGYDEHLLPSPASVRGNGSGGARGANGSSSSSSSSRAAASMGAQALAAHPGLPMFVSGGSDGSVQLWSFGAPRPLAALTPPVTAAVTRISFDGNGHLLAVAHASGVCGVYDVASACSDAQRRPLLVLEAHDKKALDLVFLPSGSTVLVTGGVGSTQSSLSTAKARTGGAGASVRVWDLLRPPHSACTASLSIPEGGCSSLLALPSGDRLVCGGLKGDLAVICCTTWRPLVCLSAHKAALKAMALAPFAGGLERFVTGGADGDVKVWELSGAGVLGVFVDDAGCSIPQTGCVCVQHVPECHDTSVYHETLGRSYGVTDLVSTSAFLLTCGGDGRLLRHPWVIAQP